MKLKPNIAISDSGFLFNPFSGESYSLNPIGVQIIQLMKEGRSEEDIRNTIGKDYKIEPATIERDIHDFFEMLNAYQLLEDNE